VSHPVVREFDSGRRYRTNVAELGDEWTADDESFAGSLARVIRVADNTRVVYATFQNGTIVRLVASGPTLIDEGDVVLVGDGRWLVVEPELWVEPRGVGIVRKEAEGSLVIESPGGLVLTNEVGPAGATAGNTVLYSIAEGALKVIDPSPMRTRDHDDDLDDLNRFQVKRGKSSLSYDEFGGYPEVVARARQVIETQFQRKALLDKIGARPVRGVLLSGPPGTGKTHLARIIAEEADAAFFLVSGPSIVSKYVGDTELLLRRIFEAAQECERAIVFFDEIDSIAGERNEGSHEASDRLVAQLLTEMDGFAERSGNVVVLAATNRPDRIDPALRRPGRFDWEITFDLPSPSDRLEILEVDAQRLSTVSPLPLEEIADASDGWSGARLTSIWTEAALLAAAAGRDAIDGEDLLAAFAVVEQYKSEVVE